MLFMLGVSAAVAFGITPAFVGFIVVALWGYGGDVLNVFSAQGRLDPSVGIALGSALQIALFVAPIVGSVQLRHRHGPDGPTILVGYRGNDALRTTMTASLVTNSGRSAWFVRVLILMVYLIFAMTLCLLPPRLQ